VYAYGTGSLFPSNTYNSSNYWVDVLYEQTSGNVAPTAGDDTGYSTNLNTPITFQSSTLLANDRDANSDPLTITSYGNAVNGSVTFNSQTNAFTFTPTNNYSGPASFTYT
ncbi:cadherin-like domain-containing protein, partial [Rhizobiaceae sp. 2RAB30]